MVKNTPSVTTAKVHTMLSGTLAAIATPAVAPMTVAASHVHARRVDASADAPMTTYAVHATRRLCSLPKDLAIRPASTAARAACTARVIVDAVEVPLGGAATTGGSADAVINAVACEVDWATSWAAPTVVRAANAVARCGAVFVIGNEDSAS